MLIYQCLVFGHTPEEVISDDVVDFVEKSVENGTTFKLRNVPEGVDPARVTTGIIGYYPPYGMPFVSDPDKRQGLFAVDVRGKRLVFEPNESLFFSMRDAVVYIQPEFTYTRGSFKDVLTAFASKGYRFFMFRPTRNGDGIVWYRNPADLPVGDKLTLEDLL